MHCLCAHSLCWQLLVSRCGSFWIFFVIPNDVGRCHFELGSCQCFLIYMTWHKFSGNATYVMALIFWSASKTRFEIIFCSTCFASPIPQTVCLSNWTFGFNFVNFCQMLSMHKKWIIWRSRTVNNDDIKSKIHSEKFSRFQIEKDRNGRNKSGVWPCISR